MRFIDVFVDPNPNAPEGCGLRFKATGPSRVVARVRLDGRWCRVAGWSGAGECPAQAAVVEDSGAGSAVLIHGGELGLRLFPDEGEPFGESHLLLDASAVEWS
jgi:hypothetical protein